MKAKRAGVPELLAFGLVEVIALLFLVSRPGKLAALLLAAVLPLAAWIYARLRAREHTGAIVGGACGLAAFPVSHGLFALIVVLPFPFQLVGLLGLIGEGLHGFPGTLLAAISNIGIRADTSLESIVVDYLFNGLVWAVIYGLLGNYLDRIRHRPRSESL